MEFYHYFFAVSFSAEGEGEKGEEKEWVWREVEKNGKRTGRRKNGMKRRENGMEMGRGIKRQTRDKFVLRIKGYIRTTKNIALRTTLVFKNFTTYSCRAVYGHDFLESKMIVLLIIY